MEEGTKCRRDCRRKAQEAAASALQCAGCREGRGRRGSGSDNSPSPGGGRTHWRYGPSPETLQPHAKEGEREIEKEGTSELATPALGA